MAEKEEVQIEFEFEIPKIELKLYSQRPSA
jgi:hypothetical protein